MVYREESIQHIGDAVCNLAVHQFLLRPVDRLRLAQKLAVESAIQGRTSAYFVNISTSNPQFWAEDFALLGPQIRNFWAEHMGELQGASNHSIPKLNDIRQY